MIYKNIETTKLWQHDINTEIKNKNRVSLNYGFKSCFVRLNNKAE